ncbi:MAG: ADP-ribosyltransferase exoenzyme [Pseudomonadota bacterium]|jgi:hypothetical protein
MNVKASLSIFTFLIFNFTFATSGFAEPATKCSQTLQTNVSFPNEQADNQAEYDYLQKDPDLIYKLNHEPKAGGPLSLAQKIAIAWYTITYHREEVIIVNGAKKLPLQSGTFFRGEPARYSEKDLGKTITIKTFRSVSMNRSVAEGFLSVEKPSQLLIIHAKSARDISPYSQGTSDHGIAEEEALLLPGVKLKIDKIYPREVSFEDEETGEPLSVTVQVVEMTEI